MRSDYQGIAGMFLVAAFFGCSAAVLAENRFELVKDDVVVMMGGADMLHLQRAGYFEAMLTHEFAAARPRFRDLSWEADTVFQQGTVIERWRKDGHGDLESFGDLGDQLEDLDTTVVIAQLGRLGSLAGEQGLAQWVKSYGQLVDTFQRQARLVVLITPTPFEQPPSPWIPDLSLRNPDLALYVKAIEAMATRRGLIFVDLFTDAKTGLTENGMHVRSAGQLHVSRQITRQLGIRVPHESALESLRRVVIEKHHLWYDYWRPANWKLLFGDDAHRQFTRGGEDSISFKEEWKQLVPLIARAEQRVWKIADGGDDPGHGRRETEELHGAPEADIKAELAAFSTLEGLQVNLFASEHEGLTSPLAIRWDPGGRVYVAVTTTYPHVFPGDVPNDKIIMLQDTDKNGKADRSTVFAEGLNIPTGLEWGDGGIYVGQNTELLFLKDTDGDGKADVRRVVLGGFGNGDSHQTINSFVWSPGGELYFCHGDGCESRVETPWGASSLFNAGFYRFRPRRLQLLPFLGGHMGPGNPWGIGFDRWGQVFSIDGAGGVNWLSPGLVSTSHVRRIQEIGKPGGYCGMDYLDGHGLPESLRGSFVIGDFKANRVKRFSVKPEGAGYKLEWKEPILHSQHRNFRPVDVKVGPDGAVYVVDWYNPITCHQDDAYRDPTRDKKQGRIWRLAADPGVVQPPDLQQISLARVIESLGSAETWTRYQAKRALTQRDPTAVSTALAEWVGSLDPKQPQYEHHLYEALGAYATIEAVEPRLLGRLLRAQDWRARAYATRMVGRWHDRLDRPLDLLVERVIDEHPQVRMEAVIACSEIPASQAIEVAARVLDKPADQWIDYAFRQTVRRLEPWWRPAFRQGQLAFASPRHLAGVLNEVGGEDVLDSLMELVDIGNLDASLRASAIASILAVGGSQELWNYGIDQKHFTRAGQYDVQGHADALARLIEGTRFRDVRPAGDLSKALQDLVNHPYAELQANALLLAGIWQLDQCQQLVLSCAQNELLPIRVRAAALDAMVKMQLPDGLDILSAVVKRSQPPELRSAAIVSLAAVDVNVAAAAAARFYEESDLKKQDPVPSLVALLDRKGGVEALAAELQTRRLSLDKAKWLMRSLFSTGRSDQALLAVFNRSIGSAVQLPDYSAAIVTRMVAEAAEQGDSERGNVLFQTLACTSCHKVSGVGGAIGPDLTAIGTTLSSERIVEELLWPSRQIKDGYSILAVLTNDGKIHQGYERRTVASQESGNLVIEDLVTRERITFDKSQIEEKRMIGSAMPRGLMTLLSHQQLLDLIQYVSELGKIR